MSGQPSTGGKICVACGKDAAGLPRVKDSRGRYFHKTCWDAAKRRAAAKASGQATPAASPSPSVGSPPKVASPHGVPIATPVQGRAPLAQAAASPFASGAESELLEELPLLDPTAIVPAAEAGPTCPACGKAMTRGAVLCIHCGFNSKTGRIVATSTLGAPKAIAVKDGKPGGSGGGGVLEKSWLFGVVPAALLLVLFAIGFGGSAMAAPFMGVYGPYSLAIWVWVLVKGFSESALSGILCLCLPFYSIYFVYGINEDPKLKYAFGANLLGIVLYGVLMASVGASGAAAFGVQGRP